MWVLAIEPGPPEKAANALNCLSSLGCSLLSPVCDSNRKSQTLSHLHLGASLAVLLTWPTAGCLECDRESVQGQTW